MKKGTYLLMVVFVILFCRIIIADHPKYSYMKSDGLCYNLEVYDTILSIRLDSSFVTDPATFAAMNDIIKDELEYVQFPGNFFIFQIEQGIDLSDAIAVLRNDSVVLMVNPIIKSETGKPIYLTNQILARYNAGLSEFGIDSINSIFGLTILNSNSEGNACFVLEFQSKTDSNIFDISNALLNTDLLIHAYPNFVYKDILHGIPQDPYFGFQWQLHNTGQTGGTPDADIDMPEAWDIRGDDALGEHIILCILDSGFDMIHEDLPDQWFTWKYDVIGSVHIFPTPDNDPSHDCWGSSTWGSQCVHGTAVMGMVLPIINSSAGIAGIEDDIKVMPIKIEDAGGYTDSYIIRSAFEYARTRPYTPDVYNCSWGGMSLFDEELSDEINWCYQHGRPIFFSSGNEYIIEYPAYLQSAFAVGATDYNDLVPEWSGQGDALDITAPGVDIWSFDLSGGDGANYYYDTCNGDLDYFCQYEGTSMSAPIVAAITAKLLRARPDIIPYGSTAEPVYEILRNTADDLGEPGWDPVYGWGRVNAYRAMEAISHGDVNHDYRINVSDVEYIIDYVFVHGPAPTPYLYLGDANCDGKVDVSDSVYLINYIFVNGAPPEICYRNLPE